MELEGEAVQVTDVEWAEVVVEVVVQEGVINGEVVRLLIGGLLDGLGAVTGSLRTLAGRLDGTFWVREDGVFARRIYVGGKVETVFRIC